MFGKVYLPGEIFVNGVIQSIREIKCGAQQQKFILPTVDNMSRGKYADTQNLRLAVVHSWYGSDPHEIANVCGMDGGYRLKMKNGFSTIFGAPGCVPATILRRPAPI